MAGGVLFECKDISERIDLFSPMGMYMKQIARLNISVQMPLLRLPGQAISSWELTERLRELITPDEFIWLRSMLKTGVDIMRFEGEVESRSIMRRYHEPLKVRAAEAKLVYPTRQEWETFFKEAKNMNDSKPGERPDTVHIEGLPVKWFCSKSSNSVLPSEDLIRKVFSQFGEITAVDLPIIEAYRVNPNQPTFSNSLFDVYIQFKEYISFVKVMDALRGMKLLKMDTRGNNAYTACIKVDFDRTKHLSENSIQKRMIESMKNEEMERLRLAEEQRKKDEEQRRREIERLRCELAEAGEPIAVGEDIVRVQEERRREREEKRRFKRLDKKRIEEEKQLANKIALEERKILVTQRKLESMRLLEELFNRVKIIIAKEQLLKKERELKEEKIKQMDLERLRHVENARIKEEGIEGKSSVDAALAINNNLAVKAEQDDFYVIKPDSNITEIIRKRKREV
ncbi:hypothetical protein GJ496_001514 [Pomphorhynchus laevis]|nr:hypothetical protein GJ496_001514 [Pomphorhynchus laevis]